jgi:hypothetical protein
MSNRQPALQPASELQYLIRTVYPDSIQTDSECLLQSFVQDPRDAFSVALMDQQLDLGAQNRSLAASSLTKIKSC